MRAALGGTALMLGALELTGSIGRTLPVWIVAFILLLGGIAVIIGFMTPLASLLVSLCVLGFVFSVIPAPPLASLAALLMVATALGIALLGPGAFSVDGHLFGRREIVIPPRSPEQ